MKLEENREMWIQRVKEFKDSNLSQVGWCRENRVNIGALRYWIKKLDDSTIADKSSPTVEFASISFSSNNSSSIEIEINNVRLSIANNYDETLLLKLIGSLKKL